MIKKLDRKIKILLFGIYTFIAVYTAFFDTRFNFTFNRTLQLIPKMLICASIFLIFYVLTSKRLKREMMASIYGICMLLMSFYYSYRSDLEMFNLLAILILCTLALLRSLAGLDRVAACIIIVKVLQMFIVRSRFSYNDKELVPTIILLMAIFAIRLVVRRADMMYNSVALKAKSNEELLKVVEIKRKDSKAAERAKNDFLASMSHEIRTPMNAICGMTDLLMQTNVSLDQKEYLQTIKNSSANLLTIINDILDLSKIDAGKMELVETKYSLLSQLNSIQNTIDVRIGNKPINFEILISKDMPTELYGDEVRVQQIMLNFLTNAVKYTEEGTIKLLLDFVKINGEKIVLKGSVQDTGIGIKKEDIGKLFAAFERVDKEKNHKIEGTGIGLTITDKLVKSMNGSIDVSSEYGIGSVFTFTIEQKVVDFDSTVDIDSDDDFISLSKSGILKRLSVEQYEIARFIAPDARVLVVDDNDANLMVARGIFSKYQVQIVTCSSGMETLDLLERDSNFDIMFIDHMMPEMDGVELVKRIRDKNEKFFREVPIIALTANVTKGIRELFLEAGCSDYMSKPIDIKILGRIMTSWIDKSKQLENNSDEQEALSNPKIENDIAVSEEMEQISDLEKAIREVPQIDVNKGLFNCANDFNVLFSVIEVYVKSSKGVLDRIEKSLSEGDLPSYAIEVHGLKSSSRSIGADELGELFYKLELESKASNREYVDANNDAVIAEYKQFIDNIKEKIAENKPEPDGSGEGKGKEISVEEFKELLSRCCEAIENFENKMATEFFKEMLACDLEQEILNKINEANEAFELFDFDVAERLLKELYLES